VFVGEVGVSLLLVEQLIKKVSKITNVTGKSR